MNTNSVRKGGRGESPEPLSGRADADAVVEAVARRDPANEPQFREDLAWLNEFTGVLFQIRNFPTLAVYLPGMRGRYFD